MSTNRTTKTSYDVVVSGISGRYPICRSLTELRNALYAGKQLITNDTKRWAPFHREIPQNGGRLDDVDRYDAGAFGAHSTAVHIMDPGMRLLHECCIEALFDAGINPASLAGTNAGVYIAICYPENEDYFMRVQPNSLVMTNSTKTMQSNRLSYLLKINGPSMVIDTACSSSFHGLEMAYKSIESGTCDIAIVGTVQITLHPYLTLQFVRLGVASKSGICRPFDDDADGYVRSETVAVTILQRKEKAFRNYALILGMEANSNGYNPRGITAPSVEAQVELLQRVCGIAQIDPDSLAYVEAHGTATRLGDACELEALDVAFARQRHLPLPVGSVKSNLGHTEPASGLCSLSKIVVALEDGCVPPNANIIKPRADIDALSSGRIQILSKSLKIAPNAVVALNNFGFGGANCALVIKSITTSADTTANIELARLVCVSARTENGVHKILDKIQENRDTNLMALLYQIFGQDVPSHLYRGYIIIDDEQAIKSVERILVCQRPIILVLDDGTISHNFSKILRNIPICRELIKKIDGVLAEIGTSQKIELITTQIIFLHLLKSLKIDLYGIQIYGIGVLAHAHYQGWLNLDETLKLALRWNENVSKQFNKRGENLGKIPPKAIILNPAKFHNAIDLFVKLGDLYLAGHQPQCQHLYPLKQFPVSRGTPMIAPLIEWNHQKSWHVTRFDGNTIDDRQLTTVVYNPNDEKWHHLRQHVFDGRNILPATGYMMMTWEALTKTVGKPDKHDILFKNLHFKRATILSENTLTFNVSIQKGGGRFLLSENDKIIVDGHAIVPNKNDGCFYDQIEMVKSGGWQMANEDIYKEMQIRGYQYSGWFSDIVACNANLNTSQIPWNNHWASFLDKMMHVAVLAKDTRSIYVPIYLGSLHINLDRHEKYLAKYGQILPCYYDEHLNIIQCGGAEFRGLKVAAVARKKTMTEPLLEYYTFVPNEANIEFEKAISINVQLALENWWKGQIQILEIVNKTTFKKTIKKTIRNQPKCNCTIHLGTVDDLDHKSKWFMVVGTNLFEPQTSQKLMNYLEFNGFAMSLESNHFNPTKYVGVTILTKYQTQNGLLVFARKNQSITHDQTIRIDCKNFDWLDSLKNVLKKPTIIYAENEPTNGILGFYNCLKREHKSVKLFFMADSAPKFSLNHSFYQSQLAKNLAVNVWKQGQWGTYRHFELEPIKFLGTDNYYLHTKTTGDLTNLKWQIGGPYYGTDDVLVDIQYAAINFRDVVFATGRIEADFFVNNRKGLETPLGIEFSGYTKNGRKVMGLTASGGLAKITSTKHFLLMDIPKKWSMAEAATIPVAYGTVFYAFFLMTKLHPGQSILIHSGTSTVGQAAIRVALYYNCTVYATCGTPEKREFLLKMFPQLAGKLGNSRDTSFERMIMRGTKKHGVDVVLNCLVEEKLLASVRCLAVGGTFIEIGKFDMKNDTALRLTMLARNAKFVGVILDRSFDSQEKMDITLKNLLNRHIDNGCVQPLQSKIFEKTQIVEAFKTMSGGKHIGKILIDMRQQPKDFSGVPRFWCKPNYSYIIIGGLGGFGMELADWLIMRGARHILLTSRNGVTNGYQRYRINFWLKYGVEIGIATNDVTTADGCESIIVAANKMGPVGAIFNLAVVLNDAFFENQTSDRFVDTLAAKAVATQHLDTITRRLCPELRHFIVFSSVACGRGNIGQTNYGMANAIMERICEQRHLDGLPATAIQWGTIGDVGVLVNLAKNDLYINGYELQSIASCLEVLDQFLHSIKTPIVCSSVLEQPQHVDNTNQNPTTTVATILGIKNLKAVSQHSTFAELGMDSMTSVEIAQTLERQHAIFLTAEELRSMTLAKLSDLQNGPTDVPTTAKKINFLFNLIDDENCANDPIVPLNDTNIKSNRQIFYFPGIEGSTNSLKMLAQKIGAISFGLHYPPQPTIELLIEKLTDIVEKHLNGARNFYFIAYSFGVLLALEVAGRLEAKGLIGTIACIDGSHTTIIDLTKKIFGTNREEFEKTVINVVLAIYVPNDIIHQAQSKLTALNTLDERLDYMETFLPTERAKYVRWLTINTMARVEATVKHRCAIKKLLKSFITLYRATETAVDNPANDLDLSQISQHPQSIIVKHIVGDHSTILENQQLAKYLFKQFME